ncbi:uncharacterized protein [Branchiostoma lanceolatum]|uniref:uncharacterized protein n=1 Tax=Branchiostoma lanceolatum TaxID=7740 RepID=UPI003452EECA
MADTKEGSSKPATVAFEGCRHLEQTTMQLSSNNETEIEVTLPSQSENQEVADTSDDQRVDEEDSPQIGTGNEEDGAVGGNEEQSKAVQPSKGSSPDLLQLTEQALSDPQEIGPTLHKLQNLRQHAQLPPESWRMIQFALDQRNQGPSGNSAATVAASAPTNNSHVDNIIAQAVQTMDCVASLESDLKRQLNDDQLRKKISIAQDRKKKMYLREVSDLHRCWMDLVSRSRTVLASIDDSESVKDEDQVASSESVSADTEESPLTDSNKEKASDNNDRSSATLAMQLHEDKVLSAVHVNDKEKLTRGTSLTGRLFPLSAVSRSPATVGCSVTTMTPITDKPNLDLNSDHAELEEESNRNIKESTSALEMTNPCQEEIPELDRKKEDEDFDEDFQNTFDGHFPGSSSRQGQSLPSRVFCHGDSYRHETPATNLSLQVGPHKSYEELHFGRPPEEESDDGVAREGNNAEAATQTDEPDLLGRCSSHGPVQTPRVAVTDDAEQPSEEGAVGGEVCPSGNVKGPTDDYASIPDPTSSHSVQGEQRDSVGELIVELQDEELTVPSHFPPYGPPAFMHLEDESYPRRNLHVFDFQEPDHEELYDELSDPSPPPSLDLEVQLTQFHAQGHRVVIEDNNGHTILSTLLAGPRLVQNQALGIATRVREWTDLRDFTLRWPGGALIPWDSFLGLPHDQGSSSSGPTTVQVQPARDGDGEWRVHWTDGQDPILQPPDDQEENAGDSSIQTCVLEGSHGPQQQHEASSPAQGSHAGPAQPPTGHPATAEEQEYGDSRCTICKEERGQLVITPCHHLFHPVCLYRWIAETDSCPNCRKSVKECSED